jgi:hypothetical protein
VKKKQIVHLDFEIDKLTNSIENSISGEVFNTAITRISVGDNKLKKSDWTFNWLNEIKDNSKQVFKLTTVNNPAIVHGLISLTDKGDHIFMDLIENAKFNKGKNKLYKGVAGNLVAFACKLSFERNYRGVVSFVAKTVLVSHYEKTLGAKLFTGNRMFIDTKEAFFLVTSYFKDFSYG